jgi:hypothetical protein
VSDENAPDETPLDVQRDVWLTRSADRGEYARLVHEHPDEFIALVRQDGVDVSNPAELVRYTVRSLLPDAFDDDAPEAA